MKDTKTSKQNGNELPTKMDRCYFDKCDIQHRIEMLESVNLRHHKCIEQKYKQTKNKNIKGVNASKRGGKCLRPGALCNYVKRHADPDDSNCTKDNVFGPPAPRES